MSVLVTGKNVVAYVPKANWSGGGVISPGTGVSVSNVEGTSVIPAKILIPNTINSCASNSLTSQTVCTANDNKVYVINFSATPGTPPFPSGVTTLTSAGTKTIGFSGGICTNCGVAMDAIHNRVAIGLSISGTPGFQFLDLPATFGSAFVSPSGRISEDWIIDPFLNYLLSASENNNYEIVDVTPGVSPAFFENRGIASGGELDSSAEDCTTRIALAPAEGSSPSNVFIADLTEAKFPPLSPAGTWTDTAGSQVQTLTGSVLSAGASGSAVAQGTHTGIVSGEFAGGSAITAIKLPTSSGTGIPAISNWITCNIGNGFQNGYDPHTVTAYQSPGGGPAIPAGHAVAVLANAGATMLAVVDLTKMLGLPESSPGSHVCASGTLPAGVVSFVSPLP